jgi:hypothetical protein
VQKIRSRREAINFLEFPVITFTVEAIGAYIVAADKDFASLSPFKAFSGGEAIEDRYDFIFIPAKRAESFPDFPAHLFHFSHLMRLLYHSAVRPTSLAANGPDGFFIRKMGCYPQEL